MTGAALPLDGHRIGVTAARKADEQIALLRRRGATVQHAPCVDYLAADDDPRLRAATENLAATGADVVVVTTGMGLRGWLAAADGWGLRAPVLAALGGATVLARGPKAAGAVREAGLREAYTPPSETDGELLTHLLDGEDAVVGRHVVLQSHGEPLPAMTGPLRAAGATVTELLPYRWRIPADTAPMRALLDAAAHGALAAVTFTSAPAAAALLTLDGAAAALGATLVAAVGEVTAKPLRDNGIDVLVPPRARTAALVRAVSDRLAG